MRLVSLLFDGITALDIVGPLQVLTHLPGVEAITVAKTAGPVRDRQAALGLVAEKALGEIDRADILLVPGGPGTRGLIDDAEVIDWIKAIHPTTTWTASVCTGSLLLGKAGLLTGKRATTHWGAAAILAALGATYVEQRVVFHDADRLVTAAGVSSGIDMALGLLAKLQGDEAAMAAQLGIEYDPQPPFDAGAPSKAPESVLAKLRPVLKQLNDPVVAALKARTPD